LKLKALLEVVKYSLWVQNFFSARGRSGGAESPNLNLNPPIISETTTARKLKLETLLEVVKYSLRVQLFFRQGGDRGCRPLI